MKILLLEDSGSIYEAFSAYSNEQNLEFIKAFQVSDAMDLFNSDIDFLIIDLHVPPYGLKKNEVDITNGGKISGWVWFENYVLSENKNWANKSIIYSGYINVLKTLVPPNRLKQIKLMDKNKYLIRDVINELKKMSQK